jgi:CRISPR system Cascade subunit CasD
MRTLLLRFAGPMQSWGVQSRFSVRDTGLEPSKSGVVGLLCAALGRPRTAPVVDLASLRMGVRCDREGHLERDYHTAGGDRRPGGAGVAKAHGRGGDTVVSERYYLADAAFLVGLEGGDSSFLADLDAALCRPKWALYLGRKAFVPGEPVRVGIQQGPVESVLAGFPWTARVPGEAARAREDAVRGEPWHLRVILESPAGPDTEPRWDVPLSFAAGDRRFALRHVRLTHIQLVETLITEPSHVPLPTPSQPA